jgi:F-box protein 9
MMYLERPFIRCDGVYVSRNTYFRLGQVHWDVKNPVHLVVYYRWVPHNPERQPGAASVSLS